MSYCKRGNNINLFDRCVLLYYIDYAYSIEYAYYIDYAYSIEYQRWCLT